MKSNNQLYNQQGSQNYCMNLKELTDTNTCDVSHRCLSTPNSTAMASNSEEYISSKSYDGTSVTKQIVCLARLLIADRLLFPHHLLTSDIRSRLLNVRLQDGSGLNQYAKTSALKSKLLMKNQKNIIKMPA